MTGDHADSSSRSLSRLADRKQHTRAILIRRDFAALDQWLGEARNPIRTLSSMLFDPDKLVQWRAIEFLGLASAHVARRDIESVRRLVRRLLWLMNDESGGLCWNAPEAIAEIIRNVPALVDEYGSMLPPYFVEEPFERGSRWAVARLASLKPSLFAGAVPQLNGSLRHTDAVIRGYSVMALDAIGDRSALPEARTLAEDTASVPIYDFDKGDIEDTPIATLARKWISGR